MVEPITASLSLVATKKVVEKLTEDIYESLKGVIGNKLKYLKSTKTISSIAKALRHVQFVKTIWQVEKEVNLFDFYYPSKILFEDSRLPITDLSQLPCDGNVVVQGTVGQGKSILFRYLTCQELIRAKAVPVLFELRKLKDGDTIVNRIISDLKFMGFDCTPVLFDALASTGKLTLFLDAFDEVPENMRTNIVAELEGLSQQYSALRILVSSRPESGIQNSPSFRVLKLAPLDKNEYKDVVRRLCDSDTAKAINSGVERSPGKIEELLTTPLMVTLLTFRYRVEQSIPENAIAFYKDLFGVLLQRHDKSKPGYSRPRKSMASDGLIQDLFDALSFVTRKEDAGEFSLTQLRKYCKQAMDACGEKIDTDKFIDDIVEITCLIAREGSQFRYIHRSVQEYHAASFVSSRPDEAAIEFYNAMNDRWPSWRQELVFLERLDEFRCAKMFLLPQLLKTMGLSELPTSWKASLADIDRVFGDDSMGWPENAERPYSFTTASTMTSFGVPETVVHHLYESMRSISSEIVLAEAKAKGVQLRASKAPDGIYFIPIRQLLAFGSSVKAIENVLVSVFGKMFARARALDQRLKAIEKSKTLFSF